MKSLSFRLGGLLLVLGALGACSNPSSEPALTGPPPAAAPAPAAEAARPVDPAHARDVFVMLSGGATQMSNNYSQYLQAKAVSAFFERNYPRDAVWTFFGAGNTEGETPKLGDVLRRTNSGGTVVSSWVPGSLNHNRPAYREVILRALREEILPAVRDGGTLYLFVGDHGSQQTTGERESVINLWTLVPDPKSERGWRQERTEELSVSDLRKAFAEGLGRGRVVFCMTQCHSGGFHHIAVPREVAPNARWFTKLPDWARPPAGKDAKAPVTYVRAAGFTATDERNLAAGCDPDPDPEKWAGYERFIPENLLGLDLFSLAPAGQRRGSFFEAHVEATLVDRTIDKPYSTSEQYLERWADLIETRLAKEPNLTAKVKQQVEAYQRAVDGAAFTAQDPAWRERQALFARFTQRLTEQNTAVKDLLVTGTRKQLDEATATPGRGGGRGPGQPGQPGPGTPPQSPGMAQQGAPQTSPAPQPGTPPQGQGQRGGRGGFTPSPEVLKLWNEAIRPAWKAAVLADQVSELPAGAREFEKYLLEQEGKGKDFLFANAQSLPAEAYWKSGYAAPATVDKAKAEAIVRWGNERRTKMLAWAKVSTDKKVRDAAEEVQRRQPAGGRFAQAGGRGPQPPATQTQSPAPAPAVNPPAPASGQSSQASTLSSRPLSRKTAAERVLFYRRTLAAWEFLLALDERPALERLKELTELERTPLPPSVKS